MMVQFSKILKNNSTKDCIVIKRIRKPIRPSPNPKRILNDITSSLSNQTVRSYKEDFLGDQIYDIKNLKPTGSDFRNKDRNGVKFYRIKTKRITNMKVKKVSKL